MDLREAYRTLDLAGGASEDAVREARKTLAKVWHPDRHANDPALQRKAEAKLAAVNAAFERIRDAGFPKVVADPPPSARPATAPRAIKDVPQPAPNIEFVPRRRVRWSVILLVVAAIGIGTYFAVMKLGRRAGPTDVGGNIAGGGSNAGSDIVAAGSDTGSDIVGAGSDGSADSDLVGAGSDGTGSAGRDGVGSAGRDGVGSAGVGSDGVGSDGVGGDGMGGGAGGSGASSGAQPAGTFGLGATRDVVRATQGSPKRITTVVTEDWYYGFSAISFDKKTGRVVGWRQVDRKLKMHIVPRDAAAAAKARTAGFTQGSTKDEVLGAQGTPTAIFRVIVETWNYGFSSVDFDKAGKVIEYAEHDVKLNLR